MTATKIKEDFKRYYQRQLNRSTRQAWWWAGGVVLVAAALACFGQQPEAAVVLGAACLVGIRSLHRYYTRTFRRRLQLLEEPVPDTWHPFLAENALFYAGLDETRQHLFTRRVQFFLAEKKIEGIGVTVDEPTRLLVAASAIIPTFAFPFYEYPNLRQVLLYPNSFNHQFQTETPADAPENRNITGMVGNGFLNGTLLLSQPDLVQGFKGKNPHNVGIHEFVHLLDMEDGAVDGLPEIMVSNAYTLPWLQVIREEVRRIRRGRSDINPYGLTNNAEFLAVVSEYFFDNPEKMEERHPELYQHLSRMFNQDPGKYFR